MINPEPPFLNFSSKRCRVVCRKDFEFFKNEFFNFPLWFASDGKIIHSDRNVLKTFDAKLLKEFDADLVVKSFKVPNLISRTIYTIFRPSKASRSFYNSWKLSAAGFSVPQPVAFIECFDRKLLKESFYISERLDFDCTLHQVFRKQMFDWELILPLVVEQAFKMHQAGLLHRDFSHGNVLVKKVTDGFTFSFVDLNRLYVGPVGFKFGLKSLVRLANDDISTKLLATHYARLAHRDELEALTILSKELNKHRTQKNIKKNIKIKLGLAKKK